MQVTESLPNINFIQPFSDRIDALTATLGNNLKEFVTFIESKAEVDDTWKFWSQFVLEDALAYVCLFLAFKVETGISEWLV